MKYPAKSSRHAPTTALLLRSPALQPSVHSLRRNGRDRQPESANAQISRPANGFADLVEAVRPAVVNISTRTIQPASLSHGYNNRGIRFTLWPKPFRF